MKKILAIVLLFLAPTISAQEGSVNGFVFSPGVILQREVFAEANISYGEIIYSKMAVGFSGVRLGVESNLKSGREFTVGPKIGYEIAMTFLTIRASGIQYFQNGNNEFRLVPEVGISIGGAVNLTYGFGIRFQKPEIADLSQHRLSLTFNINKTLLKNVGVGK